MVTSFLRRRIDPGQFGGLQGHSTVHYLITLYNFILTATSISSIPHAVIVALIDFSKAFNRICHSKVIVRLSDWGVPGWLLRILISYLSGRSMILRYNGAESSRHLMPGGSPQGALLGILLYLVYVSDIGMKISKAHSSSPGVVDLPSVPYPPEPAVSLQEARLKFVDDLSLVESIRLDVQLSKDNSGLIGPRAYHDRNGLCFPPDESLLQRRLNDVNKSAEMHDMKINFKKTKIMPFNFTTKYDFHPILTIGGQQKDVVYETQLLGLTLTSDCRWDANTRNIVTKGNSRLWFLRRLKVLGACNNTLTDIYKLFCRSVLEYAAPVWTGAISKGNKQDIKWVQRNAFSVICGAYNKPYEALLEEMGEDSLLVRRDKLTLKFAHKCLKSEKFSHWFPEGVSTRSGKY